MIILKHLWYLTNYIGLILQTYNYYEVNDQNFELWCL